MIHLALWIASLLFLAWVGFHVLLLLWRLVLREFYEAWVRSSRGFKISIIATLSLTAIYLLWAAAPAVSTWFEDSPHARDTLIGLAALIIARLVGSSLKAQEGPSPGHNQSLQHRLHDREGPEATQRNK